MGMERLAGVCVEVCVRLKRLDFLYGSLYPLFAPSRTTSITKACKKSTGCDDGRVRVYENKTDPINHETGWNLECDLGQGGKHDPANGHRAGVQSVDVSRDDAYVVSASADTTIKVRALTLTPTPLEPQAAPWPLCGAGAGRE